MILVGNQRGGAKDLALHLLKEENDHVRVHELRGFMSDNLVSALNESYAVSRGTRCRQFLFSLSLNPPPHEDVSTEEFERTIERAEAKLGLTGQPRAIVFHEKEGPGGVRRHAHAVWSRIDAEHMKAIQLSHTKRKLTDLSRDIFIERQWQMPRGLMVSGERNMRNFTLEEWQQGKRAEKDARDIKAALQDCWAVSDSRDAFARALESRGYKLARGDRRAFVAVDMHGEVYSIPRWTGLKTRDVRARLGEVDDTLPSVEARSREFAVQVSARLRELREDEARKEAVERQRVEEQRKILVERQRQERAIQDAALGERWQRETAERQTRFSTGLRGLVERLTGKAARLREQNITEAHAALHRDRAERDQLIFHQMRERAAFAHQQRAAIRDVGMRVQELDADIQRIAAHPPRERVPEPERSRAPPANGQQPDRDARREEFLRQRREQAAERGRSRGLRRDFER